ncbi:MAG: hypothetical protein O2971_03715 [Proteobacteria bacterium]|nr:hypothetical protein [Pseudomonadota bacterium]
MANLQSLLTLLCSTIPYDQSASTLGHLTVNQPLKSISAWNRSSLDFSHSTLMFTVSPDHFLGCLLRFEDGSPSLPSWRSLAEYKEAFLVADLPNPLPWKEILNRFNTAELIGEDPEVDSLAIEIVAGHKAAGSRRWQRLLNDLT